MENINEIVADIKENQENYNQVIDGIVEELKCDDCIDETFKACRFCRFEILKDLQNNINKTCSL